MRVLVVEDGLEEWGKIGRGLVEEGHAADVAATGEDALWMAAAHSYDAIVLDVMLPRLSGFETCRQLRNAGVWAPVLMLTELPWGVVNLTATEFERTDPPSPVQLTNALGLVGDEFDDVVRSHPELIDIAAVTFSGPLATTLARLEAGKDDVPERFVLSREAAEEIFRTVATETASDRAYNPGLPVEHVDTVVAACCIVLTVMRRLHLDQVTIA